MKIARLRNKGELELKNEIIEYPPELEGNRNLFTGLYTGHANHPHYNIDSWTGAVVKIKPNTTYTVKRWSPSNRFQVMTGRLDNGIYAKMTQVTNIVGDYTNNHIDVVLTVTSGENDEYLVVYLSNEGHFNDILLKVEEGNKATSYTPSPEELGLEYPDFIKSFNPKIYPHGVILTPEVVEFPIELIGKRNLFSSKFYRDINNYDGVSTYRYHLTSLDSNKRYAVRSWLKDGETATSNFWITLTSGHPNPNNASANGGTYSHIISNGNPMNSQVLPRNNVPVYISYYPPNADPSILDKYNISIQQLDSGYISEWTPAPYDLGVSYSEDISSFGIRPFGDMTMVTEIIEDCSFGNILDFGEILEGKIAMGGITGIDGASSSDIADIPSDLFPLYYDGWHEFYDYEPPINNLFPVLAIQYDTETSANAYHTFISYNYDGSMTENRLFEYDNSYHNYRIIIGFPLMTQTVGVKGEFVLRKGSATGKILYKQYYDVTVGKDSCYLTTAMVGYFGKDDDGIELTAMRELRSHSGYKYQDVLKEYAQMSHIIIRGIERSENKDYYYNMIKDVVDNIVIWVSDEEWEKAETAYLDLYYYLKEKFGGD